MAKFSNDVVNFCVNCGFNNRLHLHKTCPGCRMSLKEKTIHESTEIDDVLKFCSRCGFENENAQKKRCPECRKLLKTRSPLRAKRRKKQQFHHRPIQRRTNCVAIPA